MTAMDTVQIQPIINGFVGEVVGHNVGSVINDADAAMFRRAHDEFPVLTVRDQSLNIPAFKNFSAIFGSFEIDHHVPQFQDKAHPEVIYLTNRDAGGGPDPRSAQRGAAWHADSTYKAQPCAHTVLHALEIPSSGGGTHFADMVRAYETLDDGLKATIRDRKAKHRFGAGPATGGIIPMTPEQEAMHPQVTHAMVRLHPASGREGLYVNPLHTYGVVGMENKEATELLDRLFLHALSPEFQYLHNYRVGDLVIWDQRRTLHKAQAAFSMDETRLLMRAKISAA